ncbi:hypothetical protein DXG01_003717, partial [Tephrocybe rancida]
MSCLLVDDEIVAFPSLNRDEDLLIKKPPIIVLQIKGEAAVSRALLRLKKKLQGLTGLRAVKESVNNLITLADRNYQRELNERTGKTAVAKLYGHISADLGLLSNGEGESETKTKAIPVTSAGKILIIDEAYMLYGGSESAEFGNVGEVENLITQTKQHYQARLRSKAFSIIFEEQDFDPDHDRGGHAASNLAKLFEDVGRAYTWTAPNPEDLGTLSLDDCLTMDSKEKGFDRRAAWPHNQAYPIYAWEMGPALRRTSPLDIMHAIPILKLDSSMQITWVDKDCVLRHVTFLGMSYPQWEQWLTALELSVPPIYRPSVIPRVTFDHELLSEDEDPNGHMLPHAWPWSRIARKGPCSKSSSFVNQEVHDHFALISPGVLPILFSSNAPEFLSPSPMSPSHAVLSSDRPPTLPAEDGYCSPTNPLGLLDLTGMVAKQGRYASAHGGFSDVWKGVWHDGDRPRNVAVKVLRTKIDDPELEEKMIRRLRRELNIWKNLDHPHILNLLGTTSNFGHYSSMVCPWMENKSASKHMEGCGDIMSTSDRLKL